MLRLLNDERAEQMWDICGSFGMVEGTLEKEGALTTVTSENYKVSREYEKDESGVTLVKGSFQNISAESMNVSCLMNRFLFDGGEYEVYTQRSSWQNESQGSWQPLVSAISAETRGLREAYGAAPFFAVWNRQTNRGMAFHILSKLPWKFTVRYIPTRCEWNYLEINAGINDHNYRENIPAGGEVKLPDMLIYEIEDKNNLDCFKLHEYINKKYPRRDLPIIYNTWMYKFDKINFENVTAQIDRAAELGIEYFVIDASWYSVGNFWNRRGDWYESEEGVFGGRMLELSELVRKKGMKFGFWLEIETGGATAKLVEEHPDYYFIAYQDGTPLYFYDFSNPEACDYLQGVLNELLEKYHVEFIKFDFNQDLACDCGQRAYRSYFEGYQEFIQKLRKDHPGLYMENCASGGHRMALADCIDFDSFWLSDNASPYEGVRILRDTILRMPPQLIERWAMLQSVEDFKYDYAGGIAERLLACNDATWDDVRGVKQSYLNGFLTGGPIGFSCDLNSFSEKVFKELKDLIASLKQEKAFWKEAVCRVLTATESLTVLEYHDKDFSKVEILVYTDRIRQRNTAVYPVLNPEKDYRLDEQLRKGAELEKEGILVPLKKNYQMVRISLRSE